jgi:dTDP-4-amino-4,6-dideoxygalactose transaminase
MLVTHAVNNERGVPCFSGSYSEIDLEKAFERTAWRPDWPRPIARQPGEASLAFLVHPTLEPQHIDETCDVLRDAMRAAVA